MHAVFFPQPGSRFRPDVQTLAALLPQVARLHIVFMEPTFDDPTLPSDLAKHVRVEFRNGTALELQGVFFWKFRLSVPPPLATSQGDWKSHHDYGGFDQPQALMEGLREAYDSMFHVEEETTAPIRSPLSATLDLIARTATVDFPAGLADDDWAAFVDAAGPFIARAEADIEAYLRQVIVAGLSAPKAGMQRYSVPGGMRGQRHAYEAWPADVLERLTVGAFLLCLSTDESDGNPWRPTFGTVLQRFVDACARDVVRSTLQHIAAHDPALYTRVATTWRFASADASTWAAEGDRNVDAFEKSRDQARLVDQLLQDRHITDMSRTCADFLGHEARCVRLLTDSEIVQPPSARAKRYRTLLSIAGMQPPATRESAAELAQQCQAALQKNLARIQQLIVWGPRPETELRLVLKDFIGVHSEDAYIRLLKDFVHAESVSREEAHEFHSLLRPLVAGRCETLDVDVVREYRDHIAAVIERGYRVDSEAAMWFADTFLLTPEVNAKRMEAVRREVIEAPAMTPPELLGEVFQRRPATRWPDLQSTTLEAFVEFRVATPHKSRGTQSVWQDLCYRGCFRFLEAVELHASNRLYQSRMLQRSVASTGEDDILAQMQRANSLKMRLEVNYVLHEALDTLMGVSVRDILAQPPDSSTGFHSAFYSGPPEDVEQAWCDDACIEPSAVKRLAFRVPLGNHQLSVFRFRRYTDDSTERFYEVEATLHDRGDQLVAKVGYLLAYFPEAVAPEDLVWAYDQLGQDDVREAALSIASAIDEDDIDEYLASRVLFVRDWEVRKSDRGRRLGRQLLEASLPLASKGLPRPHLLVARVHPLQLSVFPAPEARSSLPAEIASPINRLEAYWEELTGPDTPIGKRFEAEVMVRHNRACYASDALIALREVASAAPR